jgi:hypothetical protein
LDDILRDFLKLVVSRADLRVMIFEQNTKQDIDQRILDMKAAITNFSANQSGDCYLFAGWILRERRTHTEHFP